MPVPKSALSKFILTFPKTMTGLEVVARAKAKGMTTSTANVYRVRGLFSSASTAAASTAPKPSPTAVKPANHKTAKPATKPSAPSTLEPSAGATMSKADFVRSRGHLSPREIVEDAKAAGIEMDVANVYKARLRSRTAPAKAPATPRAAPVATMPSARVEDGPAPEASAAAAEHLLRAVAAEIGLGRAIEILAADRARVRAVIGA